MRIRLLGILALSAFLIASPAWGKGPTEGTIEGPGLDQPQRFGYEDPGFGALVDATRFERLVFGDGGSRQPLPTADLGPRYLVTWQLNTDKVVLAVYPYAAGGAIVVADADQPFHGVMTAGGWAEAGSGLTKILDDLGISEEALPTTTSPTTSPTTVPSPAPTPVQPSSNTAVLAGVAAAAVLGALLVRRLRAAAR